MLGGVRSSEVFGGGPIR